jgi:hypothetical protein
LFRFFYTTPARNATGRTHLADDGTALLEQAPRGERKRLAEATKTRGVDAHLILDLGLRFALERAVLRGERASVKCKGAAKEHRGRREGFIALQGGATRQQQCICQHPGAKIDTDTPNGNSCIQAAAAAAAQQQQQQQQHNLLPLVHSVVHVCRTQRLLKVNHQKEIGAEIIQLKQHLAAQQLLGNGVVPGTEHVVHLVRIDGHNVDTLRHSLFLGIVKDGKAQKHRLQLLGHVPLHGLDVYQCLRLVGGEHVSGEPEVSYNDGANEYQSHLVAMLDGKISIRGSDGFSGDVVVT